MVFVSKFGDLATVISSQSHLISTGLLISGTGGPRLVQFLGFGKNHNMGNSY